MRVSALAFRILAQLKHDKRTLALVLFAPMLLLTLVYLIFENAETNFNVGIINAPQSYIDRLYENNVEITRYSPKQGQQALEQGDIIATVSMVSGKLTIHIDGSNSQKAKGVLAILTGASKTPPPITRQDLAPEINYVYGSPELSTFDNFGSILIGIMVFFFVFLISGITFLQERTTGTLEKLLSTPIKRWEIVCGYVMGFSIITFLQSLLITIFVVYVLDVTMIGSLWLVLLITMLSAMTALTLGILFSSVAANEFQMVQFVPIVIIPQIFFSGLFDLTENWSAVGKAMPVYYVADALSKVMIKGKGFSDIATDVLVLIGCTVLFMLVNTLLLKKYRKI